MFPWYCPHGQLELNGWNAVISHFLVTLAKVGDASYLESRGKRKSGNLHHFTLHPALCLREKQATSGWKSVSGLPRVRADFPLLPLPPSPPLPFLFRIWQIVEVAPGLEKFPVGNIPRELLPFAAFHPDVCTAAHWRTSSLVYHFAFRKRS